jgi:two-component system, OmpR family, response regulator
MRRTGKDSSVGSLIRVGELEINEDAHEVSVGGQLVDLSPTEYQLLRYLATNPNRVLTKAQILDHVWEYDFNGEMGIVESYVSYLRKKLDPLSQEPLIVTKRGVGYMLKSPKG